MILEEQDLRDAAAGVVSLDVIGLSYWNGPWLAIHDQAHRFESTLGRVLDRDLQADLPRPLVDLTDDWVDPHVVARIGLELRRVPSDLTLPLAHDLHLR